MMRANLSARSKPGRVARVVGCLQTDKLLLVFASMSRQRERVCSPAERGGEFSYFIHALLTAAFF
jgi:hypothetical protein